VFQKIKKLFFFVRGYILAKSSSSFSKNRVRTEQLKKFNILKKKVLVNSVYYSQYVNKDLDNFPVINKVIHMSNFDSINTQNLNKRKALDIAIKSEISRDFKPEYKGVSVGLSSGTSGNRGMFVLSEQERAEWAGYIIGKMLPFSLQKQRVAFFLRANNNLYQTANSLIVNFKFFDLINGIEAKIEELNIYNPSILIAPGSVLRRLADNQPSISPQRIISVAEVLEKEDRNIIEKSFGVIVEQIYQCTEGFLAATCSEGNIHLNEDSYIIEKKWLDESTGRFSPIVTDLKRQTQPVVRYLLDDVLIEDREPCKCGSSMTKIHAIEGRCDDVLILQGVEGGNVDVFSDFIRNSIISSSDEIKHYRVIQIAKNKIKIEISPFTQQIINDVSKSIECLWKRLSIVPPNCYFEEKSLKFNIEKQRRVIREYHG